MVAPLTDAQIHGTMDRLPGWSYENHKLTRSDQFADFSEALAFIVRVGLLAEQQGHHPEIANVYSSVTISLSTHDAGGKVTSKDIDLALAIQKFWHIRP